MKKIILIDDNRDILAMWKMFLDKLGYEVIPMTSCDEFKQRVDSIGLLDISCVVSDESLDDGLGTGLFEYLQEKSLYVPFIIVSGYSQDEILGKVATPDKLKVLKKPISLSRLKEVIESSIGPDSLSY